MTQKRTQEQRIDFLLRYLLNEHKEYQNTSVPANPSDKRRLLRSLMNIRPPAPVSEEFLQEQVMLWSRIKNMVKDAVIL